MKWIKKVAATPLDGIAKVIDTLATQTNERLNAPSIRAVNEALGNKWETIYPIGSIYMSVNNLNPSEVFGGTWEQIKDKFLLSSGDNYDLGDTGGEATHTLTAAELPSHNHSYDKATAVNNHTLTVNEIPAHQHVYNAVYVSNTSDIYNIAQLYYFSDPQSAGAEYNPAGRYLHQIDDNSGVTWNTGGGAGHNHGLTHTSNSSGSAGSGNAHNNMPPYLAVNVWVRTA